MKKYLLYLLTVVAAVFLTTACEKELDTQPATAATGEVVFSDAQAAQVAVDGIYALTYRAQYGNFNELQTYGQPSMMVSYDAMGDDMVMPVLDFYFFDYQYGYINPADLSQGGRNYVAWNYYYTIISNANYILVNDTEGGIPGDPNLVKNVLGQAYALRAWAYFNLIQTFQHTYLGSETAPGVPLYDAPTTAGAEGKPRGTVEDVYTLINNDIDRAITLFTEAGKTKQTHCSHIDYFVANGIKARIALVQGRNADAALAAAEARSQAPLLPLASVPNGICNYTLTNNMWTIEVLSDQATAYNLSFLYYPANTTSWGSRGPKCISNWLYDKIRPEDTRKQWWKGPNPSGEGGETGYIANLKWKAITDVMYGDMVYMRAEEMLLIQAEAEARQSNYSKAKDLLLELAKVRISASGISAYTTYLGTLANSTNVAEISTSPITTLMDEIILQRRIELWGEGFRLHDIQRLKIGFDRNYLNSNHNPDAKLLDLPGGTGPQSKNFLLKIPQTEFNGNSSLNQSTDQNPL